MNKTDAKKILATLVVAYPSFYRNASTVDAEAAANLWADIFANDPAVEVSAAVKALISTRTNSYPPAIGEVKEKLLMLRSPGGMTEQEAWALVSKAAANGIYGYKEEFEKLPPDVQSVIGSANILREWSLVDIKEFQTVVASNFMRSYRGHQQRETERAMLPSDVQKAIGSLSNKLALGEKGI